MKLHAGSIVVQAADCLSADVEEELVLMATAGRHYVALEPIGKDIWLRISQPSRISALCDALAGEYDADCATIEKDVLEFLATLVEAGLVVCQDP